MRTSSFSSSRTSVQPLQLLPLPSSPFSSFSSSQLQVPPKLQPPPPELQPLPPPLSDSSWTFFPFSLQRLLFLYSHLFPVASPLVPLSWTSFSFFSSTTSFFVFAFISCGISTCSSFLDFFFFLQSSFTSTSIGVSSSAFASSFFFLDFFSFFSSTTSSFFGSSTTLARISLALSFSSLT